MAVTVLEARSALVVIDLQQGMLSMPTAHPLAHIVANAAGLARAFRARGLPVVLVNVAGRPAGRTERAPRLSDLPPGWTDLLPELDRQPDDHVVTKRAWGAFCGTDLHAYLRAHMVRQVVLAGVSTSAGVESTAREAYALGYHVTLAIDAMTDLSVEAHAHSLSAIFPRLGERGTASEILAVLGKQEDQS